MFDIPQISPTNWILMCLFLICVYLMSISLMPNLFSSKTTDKKVDVVFKSVKW